MRSSIQPSRISDYFPGLRKSAFFLPLHPHTHTRTINWCLAVCRWVRFGICGSRVRRSLVRRCLVRRGLVCRCALVRWCALGHCLVAGGGHDRRLAGVPAIVEERAARAAQAAQEDGTHCHDAAGHDDSDGPAG
eukprot:scpid84437/ scgid3828/ 